MAGVSGIPIFNIFLIRNFEMGTLVIGLIFTYIRYIVILINILTDIYKSSI